MQYFHPGDLVEILTDRTFTDEGLTTAHTCPDGGIILSTKIDLKAYPSYSDFSGDLLNCSRGQSGNIVKYVGRPSKIRSHENFWAYDVYEILTMGAVVQIFAANLLLLERNKDNLRD